MASCKSIAHQTGKFWDEHETTLVAVSKADPKASAAVKAAQTADEMIKKWNTFFGKKSRLTIGPRKLGFGRTEKGTVTGPTQRMFLTEAATQRSATVHFKKVDGKMKSRVTICSYDRRNRHKQVKTFVVDRKDSKGKTWSATVPKGCLVSVLISGRIGANKLKYEVRVAHASSSKGKTKNNTRSRATAVVRRSRAKARA